jgi:hypothetical protein
MWIAAPVTVVTLGARTGDVLIVHVEAERWVIEPFVRSRIDDVLREPL